MEKKKLKEAAEIFGTPLYVFHTEELEDNAQKIRAALEGRADLCFAMKANPFLVTKMSEIIERIEVCSMGEFRICRALGIDPERLFISGVLKKEEDLTEILAYCEDRCVYTVESVSQYETLEKWSREQRKTLRLYLRLTSGNQFGMDEATVRNLILAQEGNPCLYIAGIHFFSGTQKRSIRKVEKELAYLDGFLTDLEHSLGFKVEELEYGPGTMFPYFKDQKDTRKEDMERIAQLLAGMRWKGKVTLEMGRAFAASCGYYLTRVRDVKTTGDRQYGIVDGGIHQIHYDGQIKGMYCPSVEALKEKAGEETDWTICGSLCTVNDVLVQKLTCGPLEPGDVLAFRNTGAYAMTEGMSLFLSHELPGVVIYSDRNGWRQVRTEQQTYEWNMRKEIY